MPIDLHPVKHGNMITFEAPQGLLCAFVSDAEKIGDKLRYTSHFDTCPDAAKFRKKKHVTTAQNDLFKAMM